MKYLTSIILRPALAAILLVTGGFSNAPGGGGEEKVMIDGKEIQSDQIIELVQDDTIYLEAYGIKPESDITIKVKKLGVKWAEDTYPVDNTGSIKAIMHVPDQKLSVNCEVTYYNAANEFVMKEFKFKVR